jgi:iron(III) transport system ATP-binding protein
MPRVLLENVSLRLGAAQIVRGVSLEAGDGEFVTLLGPSGCGKTTTLRMIAGLQQNDSGRIAIGEQVVSDPAAGVFLAPERRRLGMVFQSYAIWPHMTVFDNVAYPLKVRRLPAAQIAPRVQEALRAVAMQDYAGRPAPALSGGQQQRVAIARALVAEPKVLLLDEPLSNLDAKLRVQMGEEFRSLQKRLGITTLYVTHDQEEAMTLSDRIVLMADGAVLQQGRPEALYRQPLDARVAAFFGTPNLLDAKAEGPGRRPGFAEVHLGSWRGDCAGASGLRAGAALKVVARPEDIRLEAPGQASDAERIVLAARVTDCIFNGSKATVLLAHEGASLRAEVPSRRAPAVGAWVDAVLPVDALWCVPAPA